MPPLSNPTPRSTDAFQAALSPAQGEAGRPAVFIDKDGTLVEDLPYNVDPARLRFTPGAIAALRVLAKAALPVVIVTNQPGLATGRFTQGQFSRLQQALADRLFDVAGIRLAGFYVCPHAPGPDSLPRCSCRKPAPGLLRRAAAEHRYELSESWMIGDILDDVEAGGRAGCRTILLDVGNESLWQSSPLRTPHQRCKNLYEAACLIVDSREPRRDFGSHSTGGLLEQ